MRDADTTISTWHIRDQRVVTVPAWTTGVPGLVIQQALDGTDRFVVVHQRSGLLVATPSCGCFTAAEQTVLTLADCGDWGRSGADLVADGGLRRRAAVVLDSTGSRPAPAALEDQDPAIAARTKALAQ